MNDRWTMLVKETIIFWARLITLIPAMLVYSMFVLLCLFSWHADNVCSPQSFIKEWMDPDWYE